MQSNKKWYKVLDNKDELLSGRVMTVYANTHGICLTNHDGEICALENACPHQGGPLGEGSIENDLLRCPWHGWDYHPCSGKAPGFDDGVESYPVKIENNAVYVELNELPEPPDTISDVMVRTMIHWGIDTVFGMVGHSNLGLANAFRKEQQKGNIQYIGIRHEGAAAFAASAYGKLTGRPAACLTIAGPGATNMYTGLWDAKVDRAPLLALTGQVATQVLGTGNFQEVDLVRAFDTVAGFNQRVEAQSQHTELISRAIKHAILEREVAHLTFPDQVQNIEAGGIEGIEPQTPEKRMPDLKIEPGQKSLNQAIELLKNVRRPVIIVGHGAAHAAEQIINLAEKLHAPLLTTFKAKGVISDEHALACGVLGRSGTPVASYFMNESDLLLVFGASFSNHTGITDKKSTIQVDNDPMALAKFHTVDVPVYSEVSTMVEQLNQRVSEFSQDKVDQEKEVFARKEIWHNEKAVRLTEKPSASVSAIAFFDALSRLAPEDAIMCADVGNNAYSFGRYFETKKQRFLLSGYLGSIGFALPAAIGAYMATGGKQPVIAVAGDGGFAQYLADFTTLVNHNMPVKVIVLNNNELGKITKEQRGGGWPAWATTLTNPDFADYARSCGATGLKVDSVEELNAALKTLFLDQGAALLEVKIDLLKI